MSIHDIYDIGPLLGKGGFALVHSARHRSSGERFALKVIETTSLSNAELKRVDRELNVHKSVSKEGHPNIVKLIEHYSDKERVYIVLEYCAHGDLYKLLKKHRAFPESKARDIVSQLLQGLAFLHNNSVVHRDLKLSNLLLTEDGLLKIGDFGLATRLSLPDEEHFTLCGTPNYIAPEVIDPRGGHAHGLPADLFSVGCLLHMLLTETPPFPNQAKKDDGNHAQLMSVSTPWCPPLNSSLSAPAIDVLSRLLSVDPNQRISAHDVLRHPFFAEASTPHITLSVTRPSSHGEHRTTQPTRTSQVKQEQSSGDVHDSSSMKESNQPFKTSNHKPNRASKHFDLQVQQTSKAMSHLSVPPPPSHHLGHQDEATASTLANGGEVSINSRISASTVPRFKPVARRHPKDPRATSHSISSQSSQSSSIQPVPPYRPSSGSTQQLRRPVVKVVDASLDNHRNASFEPVRDKETTPSPPLPTPPPLDQAHLLRGSERQPPQHTLPWERKYEAPPAAPLATVNHRAKHAESRQEGMRPTHSKSRALTDSTDLSGLYNPGHKSLRHHSSSSSDLMSSHRSHPPHLQQSLNKSRHQEACEERMEVPFGDKEVGRGEICLSANQHVYPAPPPPLPPTGQSLKSSKHPRPLSTTRLQPFSHVALDKTHSFCIKSNGQATLWLKNGKIPTRQSKVPHSSSGSGGIEAVRGIDLPSSVPVESGLWMSVSSDGFEVAVGGLPCPFYFSQDKHADIVPEVVTKFDLTELPMSLWDAYRYLKNSIRVVKANTPKIELYLYSASSYQKVTAAQQSGDISEFEERFDGFDSSHVKFTMMENGPLPDFIGEWRDGTKLRYGLGQSGGALLEISMSSGKYKWSPAQSSNHSASSSSNLSHVSRNSHKLQWPTSVPEYVADHISVTQRAFEFCLHVERSSLRRETRGREKAYPIQVHQSFDVISGPEAHEVAQELGRKGGTTWKKGHGNKIMDVNNIKVSRELSEKNQEQSLEHYLFGSSKKAQPSTHEARYHNQSQHQRSRNTRIGTTISTTENVLRDSIKSGYSLDDESLALDGASIGGRGVDGSLRISFTDGVEMWMDAGATQLRYRASAQHKWDTYSLRPHSPNQDIDERFTRSVLQEREKALPLEVRERMKQFPALINALANRS